MAAETVVLGLVYLSIAIWLGLLGWRGQFWQCDRRLTAQEVELAAYPSICAVIPARNEADMLPLTLRSLLMQTYPGKLAIVLVDDRSTDGTAQVAREVAESLQRKNVEILLAEPLPSGWTGKLWALEQGIRHASQHEPDYFLLTDADIHHDPANLLQLVAKAETEGLDLVSLMVLLRCQSVWEKLLVPAFVFFFQKLYPFRWVSDRGRSTAAAAGGCILIRRQAMERIGGIQVVRQALIDDCALARAVKFGKSDAADHQGRSQQIPHPIWLGLTDTTRSLRPYPTLKSLWDMVARTAYTQLNYSPWLLLGAVLGMGLTYLMPAVGVVWGIAIADATLAAAGWAAWLLMSFVYLPTVRLYRLSPWWGLTLPLVALLYTLMTVDSALRHWRGRGGSWKGRVYSGIS